MVIVSVLLWRQSRALSISGIALSLILGGAVGNLWDRVASGKVVDFLLFYVKQYQWPVFNLADSAIVVGASLLVVESGPLARLPRDRSVSRLCPPIA